ncbi:hypothetical protein L6164_034061 [Bauhinia variegata]|uniref:Uncharacterized protein n=1 Tax=Bauhinia variegata TaxID=167791 RepID=A0ACB9KUG8_BAUVA|nr:hypothetical protein L6164_034061 [Bauhinia variegata]
MGPKSSMKLLFWNCQGMGNPLTVHNLKGICRSHSPEVMFLSETKNENGKVKGWLKKCRFLNTEMVEPIGRAGGLALAWKENISISDMVCDSFFISCTINDVVDGYFFHFIGIYASTDANNRRSQFQRLEGVIDTMRGRIVIGGDFNTILYNHEKKGGIEVEEANMQDFRDFIFSNQLADLGLSGYKYTWSNKWRNGGGICERLDRVIANLEWQAAFPNGLVSHLNGQGSDHLSILLDSTPNNQKAKKRFCFDAIKKYQTVSAIDGTLLEPLSSEQTSTPCSMHMG